MLGKNETELLIIQLNLKKLRKESLKFKVLSPQSRIFIFDFTEQLFLENCFEFIVLQVNQINYYHDKQNLMKLTDKFKTKVELLDLRYKESQEENALKIKELLNLPSPTGEYLALCKEAIAETFKFLSLSL